MSARDLFKESCAIFCEGTLPWATAPLIGCNKLNAFKLLWKISTVIIRPGGKSYVKVLSLFERYLEVNLTEKKLISYAVVYAMQDPAFKYHTCLIRPYFHALMMLTLLPPFKDHAV